MPFGFFMDKWYLLLVVPALLVAAWAQYKVHATFKKYSQVGTQRGLTGAQASELILQREGVAAAIEATGRLFDRSLRPAGQRHPAVGAGVWRVLHRGHRRGGP